MNKEEKTVFKGFSMNEQQIFLAVASVFGLKISELYFLHKKSDMQHEVLRTIELAGKICTQRSQPELISIMKSHLPEFFGFEAVGIMLRDVKSNQMFTINEISNDDTNDWHLEK